MLRSRVVVGKPKTTTPEMLSSMHAVQFNPSWTPTPAKWSHDFFEHLFKYEWELTRSPAGAHQWQPKGGAGGRSGAGGAPRSEAGCHADLGEVLE